MDRIVIEQRETLGAAPMGERLVELIAFRLRARLWLSVALGLVADVVVLVPLARLSATQHPESSGALIAVVTGAVGGPYAGLLTAVVGGLLFHVSAGAKESLAGALVSTAIWSSAAIIAGVAVDALRRSRSAQQELAVALAREEAVRETQEEAVRLSESLTGALQPRLPQRYNGLEVAAVSRPGERLLGLGGDFLDVVGLPDGRIALIIGDVAGHGPLAAALGASLRAGWRSLVLQDTAPSELLGTLERLVDMEESDEVFVTACLAWIEPERGVISVICAGHPQPLLATGDVTPLDVAVQLPLGLERDERWETCRLPLPAKFALVFYTDGLVEGFARPGSRERFGESRLAASVASMGGRKLNDVALDALLTSIETANGGQLPDDVTALVLSRT